MKCLPQYSIINCVVCVDCCLIICLKQIITPLFIRNRWDIPWRQDKYSNITKTGLLLQSHYCQISRKKLKISALNIWSYFEGVFSLVPISSPCPSLYPTISILPRFRSLTASEVIYQICCIWHSQYICGRNIDINKFIFIIYFYMQRISAACCKACDRFF